MNKKISYILILTFYMGTAHAENESSNSELTHSHDQGEDHKVNKVEARDLENYRVYLGKVGVDPNKSSHLNPRYPGVVQSVSKKVGDTVKSREVLAKITNNVGVQTYPLRANLSGKIIHRKLAVGEFVDEDRLAFSIANMETMWVDITIRQSDLKFFKMGQEVIILNRSRKGNHTTGKIFYISPVVDQHTMSATATVEISNLEGQWKPGQYVDCYIIISKDKYDVTVDNRSLVKSNKKAFVYLEKPKGKFQKQEVVTGKSDLHHTQIINGIKRGEGVALSPSSLAKNEIIQEDHGHKEEDHDEEGHKEHDEDDEEHKN